MVSTLPQRTDHSPAYNVDTARAAEAAGFDYALTQVRYGASYGADEQHESTSFSLALLLATERLKVIAAVHPYFWQPTVLAKWAATAQELTGGRLALNVVSGWFKGEALSLGATWLEHGERYRQSEEFIDVLRGAWTTDAFTYRGDFFRTRDLTFRPQPEVLPEVFQGGNSTAARQMAGRVSDWYFMNGSTYDGVAEQVAEVGGYAADHGRRVRFGLNGFAVVRDTEAEAQPGRRGHRVPRRRGEGRGLRRGGQAGRTLDLRRQGHVGGQRVQGPGAVQRRLPHRAGRHPRAGRPAGAGLPARRGGPAAAGVPPRPRGGAGLRRAGPPAGARARGARSPATSTRSAGSGWARSWRGRWACSSAPRPCRAARPRCRSPPRRPTGGWTARPGPEAAASGRGRP